MSASQAGPLTHRETLLPSAGVWVAVLALCASTGLVVIPVMGTTAAGVLAVLAMAVGAAALLASSARVEVTPDELRAGRARIPRRFLGAVTVVSPERMRELRGTQADARAYLCQRSWIAGGVLVEVIDPDDPVPYWLISSRRPVRLAAALRGAVEDVPTSPAAARDEPQD